MKGIDRLCFQGGFDSSQDLKVKAAPYDFIRGTA
jgi:hypothetical protein